MSARSPFLMQIKIKELKLDCARLPAQVLRLYIEAGWQQDSDSNTISKALKNSYCAFGAFDGKKLVGFFRAFSDGVSDAYLLDLYVDKDHRRQGIASSLTSAIVEKLKRDGIEWITAISTPEGRSMYLKQARRMTSHLPIRF